MIPMKLVIQHMADLQLHRFFERRLIACALFCCAVGLTGFSQSMSINATGTLPHSSAMLDVSDTTKGFLMPRLTAAQIGAIPSPALGLMVFNTDSDRIFTYTSGGWQDVSALGNDEMGNHTASQNILLNGYYLSGDGDNEGISVAANGFVGVGIATAQDALHVNGDLRFEEDNNVLIYVEDQSTASTNGNSINIEAGDGGAGGWGVSGGGILLQAGDAYNAGGAGIGGSLHLIAGGNALGNNSHGSVIFYTRNQTTSVERMRVQGANGNVGIGTNNPGYTLHVNGSVAGTSAYNNISDRRYKTDIHPVDQALEKVLQLKPVTYDWRRGDFPGLQFETGRGIGFIAQEVEPIVPEMVQRDDQGMMSLQYAELIPILTRAIQEQQAHIEYLVMRLRQLESQVQGLNPPMTPTNSASNQPFIMPGH